MADYLKVLLALLPALAIFFVARAAVRRRIAHALALARAEAGAELARRESELRSRLVEAETRLAEERRQGAEKLALLEDAQHKLEDAFSGLASRALSANNESFLSLAGQAFEKLKVSAQGDLDQRRQAIETLLAPMREQLARYEQGVLELEKTRQLAYGTLTEQVRSLVGTQERLQLETGNLVKALRAPQVRGRWGEMQLKRAVEFAGLTDRVDFVEQETTDTDEGRQRPDMIVRLPGGKQIVIDAKAPLAAYLDAVEARDEDERRRHLADHARQLRDHVKKLAAKSYWSQFENAPDFVVLFLPGEAFFSAALEQEPQLIEEAFGESVLIATPTTLVALLKSVAYGWRQELLAENAREISEAARTFYDRVRAFTEHFAKIGKGLEDALKAYNAAIGSYERSVLPQGRRIERLGAGGEKLLSEPEPIDLSPRELASEEAPSS
ncbi:MAG: DNA recombination protein RmuC [Thermoanaerobaculia bacterium]|nr:MAG: DNA recombination protein RmuC [Thermoanaerobaculia bacterium]